MVEQGGKRPPREMRRTSKESRVSRFMDDVWLTDSTALHVYYTHTHTHIITYIHYTLIMNTSVIHWLLSALLGESAETSLEANIVLWLYFPMAPERPLTPWTRTGLDNFKVFIGTQVLICSIIKKKPTQLYNKLVVLWSQKRVKDESRLTSDASLHFRCCHL